MIHFSRIFFNSFYAPPVFNSLYDPFGSPCRGQKPLREGPYPLPKPFAPTIGARDVAGDAIALPEFWYRQWSLYPQGVTDECLRNRVAIV